MLLLKLKKYFGIISNQKYNELVVINKIKKSGLFDEAWYLKTYSDVANAGQNPIEHYLNFGWKEGRNPSPNFDTKYYISKYMPSVNMCPLVHYEKYGRQMGISVFSESVNQPNIQIKNFSDMNNLPMFSVIVPTYNRAEMIINTLYSILANVYQKFEIIIVDDGSNDNTKDLIHKYFTTEIKNKKIRYFYKKHGGVSAARNFGLKHAKNDWIAYVDSDNLLFPTFLYIFAKNIMEKEKQKTFYCAGYTFTGHSMGQEFDYNQLMRGNYIDLGSFVHHIDLYKKFGGFDENMTRLVDWDLIARYVRECPPIYIHETGLLYNDIDNHTRITNNVDLDKNLEYFRKKHCLG